VSGEGERRDYRSSSAGRAAWVTGLVVALVVVVYGGYGHHWSWTGINGHTATLWDWLHLLLLPFAAVLLPLWLRHGAELGTGLKLALAGVLAAFVLVVAAGYAIPWAWTGFTGNTLWDWLNLAALPLAVVLIPVFVELRERWGAQHAVTVGVAGAVFVVIVVAGYTIPWAWTGFTGNTLWDWLHLLLLPLLVPVVLVPVLKPRAMAGMGIVPEQADSPEPPEPQPPVSDGGATSRRATPG
jgi:hypothetical protein